jgi:lysozyme
MVNIDRLLRQLKRDEGYRSSPYMCSAGVWTLGYGCTRWDGADVSGYSRHCTEAEAETQLKACVLDAINDADRLYATFGSYPAQLQEVLVMLAYQLGYMRLNTFVRMNRAIGRMDLTEWAFELEDSLLYRQCTDRIERYLVTIDESSI